jgi:hypothetical protein
LLPSLPTNRFTDVSGKLDERIFSKNYSFLDEYRDNEIEVLSKTVKKMKNPAKKEEVKVELLKYVHTFVASHSRHRILLYRSQ